MQVAGVPLVELDKRIEEVRRTEYFRSQLSLKERELMEGTRSLLSSRALPMPELPMDCPTCNHRWLDKCTRASRGPTLPRKSHSLHAYTIRLLCCRSPCADGKDECPKCLTPLAAGYKLRAAGGQRRKPGEVSSIKQPPWSAMESQSGVCRHGGAHTWRFGRCSKCGLNEGKYILESVMMPGECERGGRHVFKFTNLCTKCGQYVWHRSAEPERPSTAGTARIAMRGTPRGNPRCTPATQIAPPDEGRGVPPSACGRQRPATSGGSSESWRSGTMSAPNLAHRPPPSDEHLQAWSTEGDAAAEPHVTPANRKSPTFVAPSPSIGPRAGSCGPLDDDDTATRASRLAQRMALASERFEAAAQFEAAATMHDATPSDATKSDAERLHEWEMSVRTKTGSYQRAADRLDARMRADAQAVQQLHAQATLRTTARADARVMRAVPTSKHRRVKPSELGLERSWSSALGWDAGGSKRTCPKCAHRWLDKYGKDECPKCLTPLSMPLWRLHRRECGEVSTFKEPPGSGMESESGVCSRGGAHAWRFGRCRKCGKAEGKAIEEAHMNSSREYHDRARWVNLPSPAQCC